MSVRRSPCQLLCMTGWTAAEMQLGQAGPFHRQSLILRRSSPRIRLTTGIGRGGLAFKVASQPHRNTILSVLQYQGRLPVDVIKTPTARTP